MGGTALGTPVLLADIGGTNARFAVAGAPGIGPEMRLAVADYPSPLEAIKTFLDRTRPDPPPRRAALAVAGPVRGGEVRLTNARWRVAIRDLNAAFGFDPVILVNDFVAIAWAVPRLAAPDLVKIGGGRPVARAPAAVIGPGTGLGMAGIVSSNGHRWVLETEGGHATMAAADDRESALLDRLRRHYGHVSVERVVSGGGLVGLYQALAETGGRPVPARTPAEITHEAVAGSCPVSLEALNTFCAMLGTAAGNLALTLGARGGVYLAGGIVPRIVPFLAASAFRSRFEAKGRYRDYLTAIPTWVIVHPDPGFLGLLGLLERDRQRAP